MNLPDLIDGLSQHEWELAAAYRTAATTRDALLEELVGLRADFVAQGQQLAQFADAIDRSATAVQHATDEQHATLRLLADAQHTADQHRQAATLMGTEIRELQQQLATHRQGGPVANLVDIAAQTELSIGVVRTVIDHLEVAVIDGHARFTCGPAEGTVRPALIARIAQLHWNQTHPIPCVIEDDEAA